MPCCLLLDVIVLISLTIFKPFIHIQKIVRTIFFSGNYKVREDHQGKRRMKSQGSCKLGRSCISQFTATQDPKGKVEIFRVKTHYGHEIKIEHIRIPKRDREVIAAKLIAGVSKETYVILVICSHLFTF